MWCLNIKFASDGDMRRAIMGRNPICGSKVHMNSILNSQEVIPDSSSSQESGGSHRFPRQKPPRSRRSTHLLLGGVLTLTAGIMSLVNGAQGLLEDGSVALGPISNYTRYTFCGILVIMFGLVAIAGGISAIKGKNFTLALAGAALGMMGGGLFGFYLGLGALIVYALSNEDLSG